MKRTAITNNKNNCIGEGVKVDCVMLKWNMIIDINFMKSLCYAGHSYLLVITGKYCSSGGVKFVFIIFQRRVFIKINVMKSKMFSYTLIITGEKCVL